MLLLLAADALDDCCQVIRVGPHLGHAANLNLTQQSLQVFLHSNKKGASGARQGSAGLEVVRSVIHQAARAAGHCGSIEQPPPPPYIPTGCRQLDSRQAGQGCPTVVSSEKSRPSASKVMRAGIKREATAWRDSEER